MRPLLRVIWRLLAFVGKDDRVSDRFGEKLTAQFVGQAFERVFQRAVPPPKFALLAPQQYGGEWCYTLFVEGEGVSEAVKSELERELCANPHYAECRRLGQLQPVEVFRIRDGGFEVFTSIISVPCLSIPICGQDHLTRQRNPA